MNDKEHIEDAYAALVEGMFKVFFQSFTAAQGDHAAEAAAESAFRTGIAHARRVRDRAVAVLPAGQAEESELFGSPRGT